jgi:hypothetical protein
MRKQRNVKFIITMFMGLVALAALFPLTVLAQNLLTNGGFNTPFYNSDREWNGQYEKIADGWSYFYIADNTYKGDDSAPKLHWMSSAQFGSTFGGLDYHIEGDAAQMLWSSYEFDAGVYQQVSGLTPGYAYKFFIKMTTYWRGPGYPDTDGVMIKQVGIDPYGGIDPTSSNVIWSASNDNDKFWEGLEVAATAEAGTMTVFAKVYAPENNSYNHTDLDMVYFEDASLGYLTVGATTNLTATTSGTTVNLSWYSGAAGVMGYEVQHKDMAGGDWMTLQDKTEVSTSGSFTGESGHTYAVRARTWQTDGSNEVPGRWQETSVLVGDVVMGRVMNHAGIGINDVTVTVSGTATSALSTKGQYVLDTGAGTFDVVASDFGDLVAPPAAAVTVPVNGVGILDITMRPTGANQGLQNNDFETGLSNWNISAGSAAGVSGADAHTGNGSLLISNTVTVSQTGVVTGMLNPLLSFWYKTDAPFTVEFLSNGSDLTGLNTSQTKVLDDTSGWQHITIDWFTTGVYTGEVGVRFGYTGAAGANIFIDEVSIAEGPYKTYLPVLMRN